MDAHAPRQVQQRANFEARLPAPTRGPRAGPRSPAANTGPGRRRSKHCWGHRCGHQKRGQICSLRQDHLIFPRGGCFPRPRCITCSDNRWHAEVSFRVHATTWQCGGYHPNLSECCGCLGPTKWKRRQCGDGNWTSHHDPPTPALAAIWSSCWMSTVRIAAVPRRTD